MQKKHGRTVMKSVNAEVQRQLLHSNLHSLEVKQKRLLWISDDSRTVPPFGPSDPDLTASFLQEKNPHHGRENEFAVHITEHASMNLITTLYSFNKVQVFRHT